MKKVSDKNSRVASRSTKDNKLLRKLILKEQYLAELHKNGYTVVIEINDDIRLQLQDSQSQVGELREGFFDTLARNQFLENRNAWYYANYHGVAEELNGPLQEDEDKPPSQGPL